MIYTLMRKEGEEVTTLINFDAVTSVQEKWSAKVTTQTVESGFDISDSVTVDPPTYSLIGIVTSYSIFNLGGEISWNGDGFEVQAEDSEERHISIRNEIMNLISNGAVVTLIESSESTSNTDKKIAYQDITSGWNREIPYCVITSASFTPPDSGTGAFIVSLELQRVFIATVVTEELHPNDVAPVVVPYYSEATSSSSSGSGKSSSKSKKDGEDLDTSDIAQIEEIDEDLGSEVVQKSAAYTAREAQKMATVTDLASKAAANRGAAEMIEATGENYTPVNTGNAWLPMKSSSVPEEETMQGWRNKTGIFETN